MAFDSISNICIFSGGSRISQSGAPTYYMAKFSRKLFENEEIVVHRAPLDPPLFLNPAKSSINS